MGLMKAAERFDDARGVRFERYARPWIDNAIKLCFCAQQVVAEPIKRISARAARGERAHPVTMSYAEASLDGSEGRGQRDAGSTGTTGVIARHSAREWLDAGGEDALADGIDLSRSSEWLRARLSELPGPEREALMAQARDIGVCEFARRAKACRETVRTRTNAGLEYLRGAAREMGEAT